MDEEDFVTQRWTDEIRTTPIRVMVKGALLRLMPALKIEAKLPPNKVGIPCSVNNLFRRAALQMQFISTDRASF